MSMEMSTAGLPILPMWGAGGRARAVAAEDEGLDDGPCIVPIRWEDAPRPVPLLVVHDVYDVDGVPVQLIGERWRLRDLWACPHAGSIRVDPNRPDEGVVMRLQSLVSGRVSEPLSPEQIRDWEQERNRGETTTSPSRP